MTEEKAILAKYNRELSLIPPILLALVFTLFVFNINYLMEEPNLILLFSCVYIFTGFWFWLSMKKKNIFYDESNMYLVGTKTIEEIPLTEILKVKQTTVSGRILGAQFYEYQISYNSQEKSKSIYFSMTSFDKLDAFERQLKLINPDFKVIHRSHSLDL
ncbi:MAG: hypothetical protein H0X62_12410 [Bacteroidetes bacterium]|nr:hypothetical protein [Bacteroidota bacterium]